MSTFRNTNAITKGLSLADSSLVVALVFTLTCDASATIFGRDTRKPVTAFSPLSAYPWSAIGQIEATFPNGTSWGSGVMVSDFHMLTAAHVLYNRELGGRATRVQFFPQRHGRLVNMQLYAEAGASKIYIPPEWQSSESAGNPNFGYDYSLVTLDRTIGKRTGHIDIQSYEDFLRDNPTPSNLIGMNTAGYPGDLPHRNDPKHPENGLYMYSNFGEVDLVTARTLRFKAGDDCINLFGVESCNGMDWSQGQSGSPLWAHHVNGNRRVLGVLSYNDPVTRHNTGLKINADAEQTLGVLMAFSPRPGRGIIGDLVTQGAPVDLPDLTSSDDWYETKNDSFSGMDRKVQIGQRMLAMMGVLNSGSAASQDVVLSLFASIDDEINQQDFLLGSITVPLIQAYASYNAALPGIIPNIPLGQYRVGWMIDATYLQHEHDEFDNSYLFDGVLTVVPEPRSILMFVSMLSGIFLAARRMPNADLSRAANQSRTLL